MQEFTRDNGRIRFVRQDGVEVFFGIVLLAAGLFELSEQLLRNSLFSTYALMGVLFVFVGTVLVSMPYKTVAEFDKVKGTIAIRRSRWFGEFADQVPMSSLNSVLVDERHDEFVSFVVRITDSSGDDVWTQVEQSKEIAESIADQIGEYVGLIPKYRKI